MRKVRFETEDRRLVCVAEVADTFLTRLRGLLGRELAAGEGLWLTPCRSVHTIGLRFPIDVVYLTRDNRVARIAAHLRPFSFDLGFAAGVSALELQDGSVSKLTIRIGDQLVATAD